MSVAARYVSREVGLLFAVTLSILLAVAVGGRFMGYLQEAALGKFTGTTVLTIMYLRMPEFVQVVAPFALYVAMLLTVSRLHADREMIVLQAAGARPARLLQWISGPVLAVVLGIAALSLWVTPASLSKLHEFLAEQRAQTEFETVNPGAFHIYDRGQRVSYTRDLSSDRKVLEEVFTLQISPRGGQVATWAATGRQLSTSSGRYLVLRDGRRYQGVPGAPNYQVVEFAEIRQRLTVTARAAEPPVEAQATETLRKGVEQIGELHWRISLPLFGLIGALLALGVARVKPRQGRFARVVPGMAAMFGYYLLLLFNRNALQEGVLAPGAGLWLPHILFFALACYYLRRFDRPLSA